MKKLNLCTLLATFLLLAACATAPQITQTNIPRAESSLTQKPERLVTPFAIDTLYDLLVGDVALSRNQFDVALPKYVQQARQTRDVAIIEIASRVASHLGNNEASTEMAKLWVDVASDSPEARSAALQAYAMQGDAINALPHASWLYWHYDDLDAFLAVTAIYEELSAKAVSDEEKNTQIVALISAYQQLKLPQEKQPSVLLATAILHRDNAQLDRAEQVTKAFLLAAPDNQRGLLLLAQVLQQLNRIDEAVALIEDSLTRKPDDRKLRLQYARFLTITDRNQAIVQFKALHDQNPDDQDINFLLALLQLNQGEEQQAAVLLTQAASKPSLSADAHYHLGGIVDRQGNIAAALGHYRQVRFGRNYLAAASRVTVLLAQHNNVTSARRYLQRLRIEQPKQSVSLLQIESNLLISANQPDQALSILTDGLDAFPNDAQLLYARSMVAEQQDNWALAEQDLRTLIEQNQNNATALNALGYTMIVHTDRHEEAYALIKRAYLLNPGDPATIDSLGWVLFKMGELDTALVHLTKAIGIMPDPEIAAHLGEVQWSLGDKDSAIATWAKGLQQAPGHQTIVTTVQRLGAELDSPESGSEESQP